MADLEWMSPAFLVLETLPEKIAFGIVRQADYLREFPKMGNPLGTRFPELKYFRQILYKRSTRIIYEFDEAEDTVYILAIQDCRQKMPTARDLKRDRHEGELPLD